jgi:DNA mismatch endonuclease (patch repair protein)
MARIRGSNTAPEIAIRRALWSKGFRYRIKSKLPGRPDVVFASARVVVFIDGCFWHRCPSHGTSPKQNAQFWRRKIDANVKRDMRVRRSLRRLGWSVINVWEHEIDANFDKVLCRIVQRLGREGIRKIETVQGRVR